MWVPLLFLGHLGLGVLPPWWGNRAVGESRVCELATLLPGSLCMLALLSCGQGAQDVSPPLLLASLVVQALLLPGEGARFLGADADAALLTLC